MADLSGLYPQPQAPVNPLTMASNALGVVGQLNQNRLFQQQNQARQAIGSAYQQSIDPQTGQLDTNKLMQIIGQPGNPASFMAGDVAQQALQRQQSQIGIAGAQQDLAQKYQAASNMVLGGLAGNKDATAADAYKAVAEAHKNGLLPDQFTAKLLDEIPSDPNQFQPWLNQHAAQALDPTARAALTFGTPTTIDTGAGTQIGYTSPTTGYHPGAFIGKQLSPADLAAPKTWYDPASKQQVTGTTAQYLAATGGGGLPPSATGAAAPTSAPAASPFGTGRITAPPSGPLPAGPALGSTTAADTLAGASAKQIADLQANSDQASQVLKPAYGNMLQDLKDFTPGPGADWTKVAKSFINRIDPQILKNYGIQFDPQAISSQEGFAKLANQIALAQGAQSDMHLTLAEGANPSDQLSALGANQIIGRLQGVQDSVIAKNKATQSWLKNGGDAKDFGQFSSDFNNQIPDPRVFQVPYMSKQEYNKFRSNMTPQELNKFRQSFQNASSQGLLSIGQ